MRKTILERLLGSTWPEAAFIKAGDTERTDIKKLFDELKKAEGQQ